MSDDLDLEKELADSIAQIVEEETTGAEVFVKNRIPEAVHTQPVEMDNSDMIDDDYDLPDDNNKNKKHSKTIIIIVASIVAAMIILGVAAFFVIRTAYNNSKNNFDYYAGMGNSSYTDNDYENAVSNYTKALEFDTTDTNRISVLYSLYKCYEAIGDKNNEIDVLTRLIEYKDGNYAGYVSVLVSIYDKDKEYDKIQELYENNKDSGDDTIASVFAKYVPSEPVASPVGDTYSDDQNVTLAAGDGCTIYYTTDGSDPTTTSEKYTDKIQVKKGNTTLKFISVNEYNIATSVITEEYSIDYAAPEVPVISPEETSFSQSSKVMVTISNIASGATVYYTIDGSTPNEDSKVYDNKPFELPSGTITVNVLVKDSHGLTSRATKTYTVSYISKYNDSDAKTFIWSVLKKKKVVDSKYKDKDGNLCELNYYSKKTIDSKAIYMFYFTVDGENEDYWYGANADTGEVYKITGSEGEYKLSNMK